MTKSWSQVIHLVIECSVYHAIWWLFWVYIEYQNFTRIHIKEIILQVLIVLERINCWLIHRNVQLWDTGTIGYICHISKTNKHKITTQHRQLKRWTTWASPKVKCSWRECSSCVVNIKRARSTDLPFACPRVAHRGN